MINSKFMLDFVNKSFCKKLHTFLNMRIRNFAKNWIKTKIKAKK